MDNLFHIFKFVLPVELIHFIIPYTYEVQSNALTNDIQSFYTSKPIIHSLYYNKFVIEFDEPEPSDKEWLINDLSRFSNPRKMALGLLAEPHGNACRRHTRYVYRTKY
jgi:hypothetical protein